MDSERRSREYTPTSGTSSGSSEDGRDSRNSSVLTYEEGEVESQPGSPIRFPMNFFGEGFVVDQPVVPREMFLPPPPRMNRNDDRERSPMSPEREYSPARSDSTDGTNWEQELIIEDQRDEIHDLKRKLGESRRECDRIMYEYRQENSARKDYEDKYRDATQEVHKKDMKITKLNYDLIITKEDNNVLVDETVNLTDIVEQYFESKEIEIRERKRVERKLTRKRQENKRLRSKIKEIKNGEEYMKTIEKERRRADNYRKMMLNMSSQLREDGADQKGEVPAWKTCEICLREYSEQRDLIPRVLSCGHTVCHSCLVNLYTDPEGIKCPFDRTLTEIENNDVSTLPKNYSILQM
ncbi:hypothetical protein GCK72_005552 [Caenorhabditis remanei]|uniref:RING-type domain-containing protein n=1 Tax=Caenorhabditis remanei TaxID=31234 RepID=A0A6A5HCW3_CAERE|nr:hypothetical protein GCK72_005552 [Caenorhabditis remanei]KAF1765600.1 hypothetical protein GCK72_005552 [Caenorhabditis remanei]